MSSLLRTVTAASAALTIVIATLLSTATPAVALTVSGSTCGPGYTTTTVNQPLYNANASSQLVRVGTLKAYYNPTTKSVCVLTEKASTYQNTKHTTYASIAVNGDDIVTYDRGSYQYYAGPVTYGPFAKGRAITVCGSIIIPALSTVLNCRTFPIP
jgi:hypothetical protein